MNAWFAQHRAALAAAFRRLWATPLNTLLSLLVIGIALTLPAFGYVAARQPARSRPQRHRCQQISLFMNLDASKKDIGEIENRLRRRPPASGVSCRKRRR
jgi:cell division transport system permease protein